MASTQTVTTSFKKELLKAIHNFSASGGHTFKMALYTSTAAMSATTTVYSATNEITGTGYSAGGMALTNVEPSTSGTTGLTDFADPTWTSGTFTARYALIYNTSASNKSVAVLDFGADKTCAGEDFTVVMPVADASNAIVRIA